MGAGTWRWHLALLSCGANAGRGVERQVPSLHLAADSTTRVRGRQTQNPAFAIWHSRHLAPPVERQRYGLWQSTSDQHHLCHLSDTVTVLITALPWRGHALLGLLAEIKCTVVSVLMSSIPLVGSHPLLWCVLPWCVQVCDCWGRGLPRVRPAPTHDRVLGLGRRDLCASPGV